ncbi:MAG: helix-turn-helix transcriptional regulator [Candidatus Binataceae bacterium]
MRSDDMLKEESGTEKVFYTTREIAEKLGTTTEALRLGIKRGAHLPARLKLGSRWVFPAAAFQEWVASLNGSARAASQPHRGPGRPRKLAQ